MDKFEKIIMMVLIPYHKKYLHLEISQLTLQSQQLASSFDATISLAKGVAAFGEPTRCISFRTFRLNEAEGIGRSDSLSRRINLSSISSPTLKSLWQTALTLQGVKKS